MAAIGVITGTPYEADCLAALARSGDIEIASTLSGTAAEAAARLLADSGCRALVSFGTAGALDPALAPGDLVIADAAQAQEGAPFAADAAWREALSQGLSAAGIAHRCGLVFAAAAPLAVVAEKTAAFRRTGALCVDMETFYLARVALDRGLPWVAVRAIADPAGMALPRAIIAGIDKGEVGTGALLSAVVRQPAELGAMLRFAWAGAKALRTLRRVAAAGFFREAL